MYNYEWDKETGGYILLPTKITGVSKEVRPVYSEELNLLGFDKNYGWNYPLCDSPLMWAEGRKYIYRGEVVAEAVGGGLFSFPVMKNAVRNLEILPVDVNAFALKNANILNGLVQRTLKDLYKTFEEYRNKVDMCYAAFSGGKDSVAMLDIVQRALPHDSFDVVFGNTTMELSDTYANVEVAKNFWNDLNWHEAKTEFEAKDSWKFVGPPARTIRWCCGVHKSAPSILKIKEILATRKNCDISEVKNFKVLAFTGVRKEESEARSTYEMVSEGNKHTVQINCNPILEWSTCELFLYIYSQNLPIIEANRDYLLSPTEVWGIVEIIVEEDNKSNVFKLIDFQPFCPYTIDLDYYIKARKFFTVDEWLNVLLSAIDYNPKGYVSKTQKMAMLSRLLPFVEKRINLIELAPKETGKSYVFAQISKYGWLVSGGSISRAKMFFDIGKKTPGLVSRYDYVAFDEIQSIKFTDAMEMQGALKGYLESGEYRVEDTRGVGDAGLILLGNIDSELMDVNRNMFTDLPDIFHESALLDRFHGFIKGWNIPKMKESLKANGWALNTEYFGEIMHVLRDELAYRAVVDQLLQLPKNSATRDTEAIKRICTGYLKLLFPDATDVSKVDISLFKTYCLVPAMEMRRVIKNQLGIIDRGEFGGSTIPDITIKEQYCEEQ